MNGWGFVVFCTALAVTACIGVIMLAAVIFGPIIAAIFSAMFS